MSTKSLAFVLCLVLILGCSQNEVSVGRFQKLTKAIKGQDAFVRFRAIPELGQIAEHNTAAQKLLIRHLFSEEIDPDADGEFFDVVKALSRSDSSTTIRLIKAYQDFKPVSQNLKRLLFVLGRMGPKAKAAVPFLLEQLEKHRQDPEIEGSIRVVLANIGYKSDENLATILSDIRKRTERGKSEILMITLAGPRDWLRGDITKEFRTCLNESYESDEVLEVHLLSIILSVIGEIDNSTAKRLDVFLKAQCKAEGGDYIDIRCLYFGFVLAKADPTKADETLRTALKYLALVSPGHGVYAADILIGDILIASERNMMKELVKTLDDSDPNVVTGAMWMLFGLGLDAKEYSPKVLKILKENPDEDLREIAALSLSTLADVRDLPTLQAILGKEQSEFVRDEIVDTMRIIRLEEEE